MKAAATAPTYFGVDVAHRCNLFHHYGNSTSSLESWSWIAANELAQEGNNREMCLLLISFLQQVKFNMELIHKSAHANSDLQVYIFLSL